MNLSSSATGGAVIMMPFSKSKPATRIQQASNNNLPDRPICSWIVGLIGCALVKA